jgi:hypothetical protein
MIFTAPYALILEAWLSSFTSTEKSFLFYALVSTKNTSKTKSINEGIYLGLLHPLENDRKYKYTFMINHSEDRLNY